jgi:hypothetical protein
VIVIDGSLSRPKAKSHSKAPIRHYHIQNSTGRPYQEIQGLLYHHLFLPRADTWTLFTNDISSIYQVENLLTVWCAALSSDSLKPTSISRPRLIIILTNPQDAASHPETMESTLQAVTIPCLVASVRVLDLQDRVPLSPSYFKLLQRLLSQGLDEAYLTQHKAHNLFSTIYLDWIWRKSLLHVAWTPTAPFNYI